MKRFGLYHPGDASVAVAPRVGFLDKPVLYRSSEYGSAPPPSAKRN